MRYEMVREPNKLNKERLLGSGKEGTYNKCKSGWGKARGKKGDRR